MNIILKITFLVVLSGILLSSQNYLSAQVSFSQSDINRMIQQEQDNRNRWFTTFSSSPNPLTSGDIDYYGARSTEVTSRSTSSYSVTRKAYLSLECHHFLGRNTSVSINFELPIRSNNSNNWNRPAAHERERIVGRIRWDDGPWVRAEYYLSFDRKSASIVHDDIVSKLRRHNSVTIDINLDDRNSSTFRFSLAGSSAAIGEALSSCR
jgi:hypothetical protein